MHFILFIFQTHMFILFAFEKRSHFTQIGLKFKQGLPRILDASASVSEGLGLLTSLLSGFLHEFHHVYMHSLLPFCVVPVLLFFEVDLLSLPLIILALFFSWAGEILLSQLLLLSIKLELENFIYLKQFIHLFSVCNCF